MTTSNSNVLTGKTVSVQKNTHGFLFNLPAVDISESVVWHGIEGCDDSWICKDGGVLEGKTYNRKLLDEGVLKARHGLGEGGFG